MPMQDRLNKKVGLAAVIDVARNIAHLLCIHLVHAGVVPAPSHALSVRETFAVSVGFDVLLEIA